MKIEEDDEEPSIQIEIIQEIEKNLPDLYKSLTFFSICYNYLAGQMLYSEDYETLNEYGVYKMSFKFLIRGTEDLIRSKGIFLPPALLLHTIDKKNQNIDSLVKVALNEYNQSNFPNIKEILDALGVSETNKLELKKIKKKLGFLYNPLINISRCCFILLLQSAKVIDDEKEYLQHIISIQILISGINGLLKLINYNGSVYKFLDNFIKKIGITFEIMHNIYTDTGNELT